MASTDFLDLMNGTGTLLAHTSDSGHTYNQFGMVAGISLSGSGTAYGATSVDPGPYPSWTPPSADYRAIIRFRVLTPPTTGDQFGLALRFINDGGGDWRGYYFQIVPGTGFQVVKAVDGSYVQQGTTAAGSIVDGDEFDFTVTGSNPVIMTLKRNGTTIVSASDSSSPLTGAGTICPIALPIGGTQLSTAGIQFDTIWAGPAAGPSSVISPASPTVTLGATQAFTGAVYSGLTGISPALLYNWTATHGTFSGGTGVTGATYTAPGSGTTDTVTATSPDLSALTATDPVTLSGSAATSYTATATPTTVAPTGTVTAPVTPNGLYTGTITGTPSGSAAVGLSPVVKTFSNSSTPQNATWTPTVLGTLTITWTNNGSLSNPSPSTITVENIVEYFTGASNVTGTPTFAVYNSGTNMLASGVTASSPVQVGSTSVWLASFTAPIGDYDAVWDNNGTYAASSPDGQITGSGTFTYFTHVSSASGTPTFAVYNAGTGTSATVTATSAVEIGSTEVWEASFTAAPGNYVVVWDNAGTYLGIPARLTYADQPSGGGGTTVSVLGSPTPTTKSFAVLGSVLAGIYPGCVGRNLQWAPGSANVGYSGKLTAQQIVGIAVQFFCEPPMSNPPNTGDIPVIT